MSTSQRVSRGFHLNGWQWRLLALDALLLLTGCTTAVESTSPYTLSPKDVKAVVSGIDSALKDASNLNVGKMNATTRPDGHIYVCGWLSYKSDGYYSGEHLFFGILFANSFASERIGTNALENSKVLAECHQHGVMI